MKRYIDKSILIVDDEEIMRGLLVEEFVRRGAKVTGASGVEDAIKALQLEKFDAVISDYHMPGGDGLLLFKKIHELFLEKPKLFLCTGMNELSHEDAQKIGISAVFEKPFSLKHILETVITAVTAPHHHP